MRQPPEDHHPTELSFPKDFHHHVTLEKGFRGDPSSVREDRA